MDFLFESSRYIVPAALAALGLGLLYVVFRRSAGASVGAIVAAILSLAVAIAHPVAYVLFDVEIDRVAVCAVLPDAKNCATPSFCKAEDSRPVFGMICDYGNDGTPPKGNRCVPPDTSAQIDYAPRNRRVRPRDDRVEAALRSGPGLNFPLVAQVPIGTVLQVEGRVTDRPQWYRVRHSIEADQRRYFLFIDAYRKAAYCPLRLERSAPVYIHASRLEMDG